MLLVFENLEARAKSIYNVDVLTAIRWTETESKNCPAEVIINCFNHCLNQDVQDGADVNSEEAEKDIVSQMARDAE